MLYRNPNLFVVTARLVPVAIEANHICPIIVEERKFGTKRYRL